MAFSLFISVTCLFLALNENLLVTCWDSDDLEVFDLVEEVNQNFYDVLNVSNSADSNDLRRAYRKLSLTLHPDKNKEPDAEVKFRQMVSVFETLKDEKKRVIYDEILLNGLPDWRQPVFYYRRVRKMGLVELSILLSIIVTSGHFITIWSIYLEKCFEKEEVFRSRKKRDKKNRRARQPNSDGDDELQETLSLIQRPVFTDLLPFAFARLVYRVATSSLPNLARSAFEFTVSAITRQPDCNLDESSQTSLEKARYVRKRITLAGAAPETLPCDMLPFNTAHHSPLIESSKELAQEETCATSHGDWSDAEIAMLAKAVARYPGGTSDRWQKIAQLVGRSVKEVTLKSQQVKTQCVRSVNPCTQGITATMLPNCSSSIEEFQISDDLREYDLAVREYDAPNLSDSQTLGDQYKADDVRTAKLERTSMIANPASSTAPREASGTKVVQDSVAQSASAWTQQQQRLLEVALNLHPKGTLDRWDRIAGSVSGKTKEECIQRFKYLAELVVKKKHKQTS